MQPGEIMEMLAEGERKAIAKSTAVAQAVLTNPKLVKTLVDALSSTNPTIVSHAAHALLTVFKKNPSLLRQFADQLMSAFRRDQWEILEQLAKILPGLDLPEPKQRSLVDRLEQIFYESPSSIARTCALQALDDLGARHQVWRDRSTKAMKYAFEQGSKAMQARARKILAGR